MNTNLENEIVTTLTSSNGTALVSNTSGSNLISNTNAAIDVDINGTLTAANNTMSNCVTLPNTNYYSTWTYPTYNWTNHEIQIRQVKNGYICTIRGEELVFNKLANLIKEVNKTFNPSKKGKKK